MRQEETVYIPEHFRNEDRASALAFMRANPFVILVSNTDEGPFATHVPVIIRESADHLTVRGHVAKANPHWQYLQNDPMCLMIFHGPHAYISPSNYDSREVVPTWNYGAVHIYGNATTYAEPEQLLNMLHDLIPTFDASYEQQWDTLSETYRQRMLSHIVGFEIAVTKLEAKFKLSQNRTRNEQQHIIDSLSGASDTAVSGTARLMCEHGLGLKKEEP
ncbi:MAG TPA: FMN-binding negative transcriptional regulator [Candidatus Sulfotelmatobacter sp.]|nr:FMN-binding negative transcriptional regulator [Candidatus Sulfotelmatobacter sp.]